MTVLTLMASALDAELQARGVFALGISDCEEVIAAVIERTAEAGNSRILTAKAADDVKGRGT